MRSRFARPMLVAVLAALAVASGAAQTPLPQVVQKTPDAVVIAAAKKVLAADIDPKLPRVPVEEWVRGLVGPQPKLEWGVNDCGEQSGNPAADRGRDFPMCAEIHVLFAPKRDLYLPILVGTFGKGLTGGKPGLYYGVLVTDGKQQWMKNLSELPAVLAGKEEPKKSSRLHFFTLKRTPGDSLEPGSMASLICRISSTPASP